MTKNRNAHTQRHCHDQLSADGNKSSTARTSIHPTQEGHWQLSTDVTANIHTHAQRTSHSRMTRKFLLVADCVSVDPCSNHWTGRLTFVHMFTVRKHKSNESRCLVMCTSKGNSGGDSQRFRLQIPIYSYDRTWWWKFLCHNVDVWTRMFLNCTSDGSCTENCNEPPCRFIPKMMLPIAIMIVKGLCVRTCTRFAIWVRMTTSRKIFVYSRSVTLKSVLDADPQLPLTPMNSLRTLPWHSLHQRLRFKLFTFLEIEASMNDAYGKTSQTKWPSRFFVASHWSENDDASREAALTKHVNVDEVARHSTIRSSRIATLLGQTTCSKQRERRRFEGTRRAWSSRFCSVGQTADKDHYRLPQWSRLRKDHLTLIQISFDS